jgi:hypothetical protein
MSGSLRWRLLAAATAANALLAYTWPPGVTGSIRAARLTCGPV